MAFVTKGVDEERSEGSAQSGHKLSSDWRRGVTYQIYPRSFADGNNDGTGDIRGAMAHLSYLKDLGADAVWVSPWFLSPMADGGYDVADYCDISPLFGTLCDAEDFISECHRLGLKVIIDLVANHCSSEHRWFQAALAAAPGSPEREWFYFRDGRGENGELPPTDFISVFGGRAWTRVTESDGTLGQWYLHLFDAGQPDLNWGNPAVRDEFERIFRFWFDRGVDGLRLDAVPAIGKDLPFQDTGMDQGGQFTPETSEQTRYWDAGDVHEIVKSWRSVAESYDPPKYLVGEINVSTTEALLRYIRPGELQSVFTMNLVKSPWNAQEFEERIKGALNFRSDGSSWLTWALSSHDEVRSVTRFAVNEQGELDMALGAQRARAALLLTLALPGGACIYQGEEIGLPQVSGLPLELLEDPIVARTGDPLKGRDGCRVAMPWDESTPSFGFSASAPPRLPQPSSWGELSVARQSKDASSFLNFSRAALHARRDHIEQQPDECRWNDFGNDVLSFDRGDVRCIVNFGSEDFVLPANALVVLKSDEGISDAVLPNTGVWIQL
jgi:alpha-glucosidase